jgi:hypothetical protein
MLEFLTLLLRFGEISCCKIFLFSAAFCLRVGVELLRFFRGDGEPTCKLFSLDEEFSFGIWEDIAGDGFDSFFGIFDILLLVWLKQANREKHINFSIK